MRVTFETIFWPDELRTLSVDFSGHLDADDTVVSAALTAVWEDDESSAAALLPGGATVASDVASFSVQHDGTTSRFAIVTVVATTAAGEHPAERIRVYLKDLETEDVVFLWLNEEYETSFDFSGYTGPILTREITATWADDGSDASAVLSGGNTLADMVVNQTLIHDTGSNAGRTARVKAKVTTATETFVYAIRAYCD